MAERDFYSFLIGREIPQEGSLESNLTWREYLLILPIKLNFKVFSFLGTSRNTFMFSFQNEFSNYNKPF